MVICKYKRRQRTDRKNGKEYVNRLADQSALSRDAHSSSVIIASRHSNRQVSVAKCFYGGSRARLQLVLKDDETEESKAGFGLLPGEEKMIVRAENRRGEDAVSPLHALSL